MPVQCHTGDFFSLLCDPGRFGNSIPGPTSRSPPCRHTHTHTNKQTNKQTQAHTGDCSSQLFRPRQQQTAKVRNSIPGHITRAPPRKTQPAIGGLRAGDRRHPDVCLWQLGYEVPASDRIRRCRAAGRRTTKPAGWREQVAHKQTRSRTCARAGARMRTHTRACARANTHTSRTSMFDGRRLPCARPSRCRYPSPSTANAVYLHRRGVGSGWVRGAFVRVRGGVWAHVRKRVGQTGQSPPGLAEARRA